MHLISLHLYLCLTPYANRPGAQCNARDVWDAMTPDDRQITMNILGDLRRLSNNPQLCSLPAPARPTGQPAHQ